MRRTDRVADDGTWTGLALEAEGRPRPGLCLFAGDGRMLLTQETRPVLLAAVSGDHCEVRFWRTDAYRSVLPPWRADTARDLAGRPDRWAHRFAEGLAATPGGPLHDGRWLLTPQGPPHWNRGSRPPTEYWGEMIVEGHPDGSVDWFSFHGDWTLLPLRPMPGEDDARVKAYRKQAREGVLPPVLLWWVSGLYCHVVLDGHARLAAALAESVDPPLLHLVRTAPGDEVVAGTRRAVEWYEAELARFAALRVRHGDVVPDGAGSAGPVLARRLEELRTATRPTWAWPLPGGTEGWRRVVRETTGGAWDGS
ncbi:hypothetical protein [Streptomyces sp. NPDC056600]|uniref:hypothetical protein n=1 Tax=Streptomyces sp. NPDC056600 TaxID=3345874 RepID=UPI00369856D0